MTNDECLKTNESQSSKEDPRARFARSDFRILWSFPFESLHRRAFHFPLGIAFLDILAFVEL